MAFVNRSFRQIPTARGIFNMTNKNILRDIRAAHVSTFSQYSSTRDFHMSPVRQPPKPISLVGSTKPIDLKTDKPVSEIFRDWEQLKECASLAWPESTEDKLRVVGSISCLVAGKIATVAAPVVLGDLTNGLAASPETVSMALVGAYGLARLSSSLFGELKNALFANVSQAASRRLASRTFAHMHTLDLDFLQSMRVGELSALCNRGVKSSIQLLNMTVFMVLPTVIEFGLVMGVLAVNAGWATTGITLGTLVGYTWFTTTVTQKRVLFRRKMIKAEQESAGLLSDSLINAEAVKLFANEKLELERYGAAIKEYEEQNARVLKSLAFLNFGQQAIFNAGLVGCMAYTTAQCMTGAVPLGSLVLVNSLLFQLAIPLNMVGTMYRETKLALIDMDKIARLLKLQPRCTNAPNAVPYQFKGGRITFDNVDFTYTPPPVVGGILPPSGSTGVREIFKGLNLEVQPGQLAAVVGPSGSGKSTLVKMALRMYDPSNRDGTYDTPSTNQEKEGASEASSAPLGGRVLLDGQDLRGLDLESIRSRIAVIPQDVVLFNASMRYNVGYGRPGATNEEIDEAVRLAHLDDLVARMPNGLETSVGERGLKLSGGEKQRVGIARALLRQPDLVLLDEATSALDNATERRIMQTFRQLWKGKTRVVIAHRLTTVQDADIIFHVKGGRVTEKGTHDELIALGGDYARLWFRQVEDQLEDEAYVPASEKKKVEQ